MVADAHLDMKERVALLSWGSLLVANYELFMTRADSCPLKNKVATASMLGKKNLLVPSFSPCFDLDHASPWTFKIVIVPRLCLSRLSLRPGVWVYRSLESNACQSLTLIQILIVWMLAIEVVPIYLPVLNEQACIESSY